jgi:hypothetical protein
MGLLGDWSLDCAGERVYRVEGVVRGLCRL